MFQIRSCVGERRCVTADIRYHAHVLLVAGFEFLVGYAGLAWCEDHDAVYHGDGSECTCDCGCERGE